ncbi:hypothetical protein BJ981_004881 [Sphaerisporangium krabiense]|uniref:Uncharacterized protein n=1 Tax=Sphaerisporangium krabiense TaxID=763782 RepID=A0A7W9DS04_9ACTN|nr:hypothetical protein [Sphaerisporangium krabiense]
MTGRLVLIALPARLRRRRPGAEVRRHAASP